MRIAAADGIECQGGPILGGITAEAGLFLALEEPIHGRLKITGPVRLSREGEKVGGKNGC